MNRYKLTEKDQKEIYRLFEEERIARKELAKKYNISVSTVYRILVKYRKEGNNND